MRTGPPWPRTRSAARSPRTTSRPAATGAGSPSAAAPRPSRWCRGTRTKPGSCSVGSTWATSFARRTTRSSRGAPPAPTGLRLAPSVADGTDSVRSAAMASRVFLIRHADVENPRRLLYGHLDGFALSALGRAQAAALGDRPPEGSVARLVHSPLARAVETAQIINSRLAAPVPMEPEPELREAEFSRYLQGLPYWQIPLMR